MNNKTAGEIRADVAYTVAEFCKRTGIGSRRLRNYFPVRMVAGRRFIVGADFIEKLRSGKEAGPDANP